MPTHPKITQVPRVIHDVLDVMGRPSNASLWSKINSSKLGHPSVFGYISEKEKKELSKSAWQGEKNENKNLMDHWWAVSVELAK